MVSCELGISHYTYFPFCNGGVLLSRFTAVRSAVVLVLLMLFDIVKLSLLAVAAVMLLKYLMCICFVSTYSIMKESSIIVIVITCHFEGETM